MARVLFDIRHLSTAAIHYAAMSGRLAIADLLLGSGEDKDRQNNARPCPHDPAERFGACDPDGFFVVARTACDIASNTASRFRTTGRFGNDVRYGENKEYFCGDDDDGGVVASPDPVNPCAKVGKKARGGACSASVPFSTYSLPTRAGNAAHRIE